MKTRKGVPPALEPVVVPDHERRYETHLISRIRQIGTDAACEGEGRRMPSGGDS